MKQCYNKQIAQFPKKKLFGKSNPVLMGRALEGSQRKSYHSSGTSLAKIGFFGDIHFQDVGLERVVETGEWIAEEFKRQNLDYVVCLGDVLNTRETVSVKAQSAAFEFFDRLSRVTPKGVHVICGEFYFEREF